MSRDSQIDFAWRSKLQHAARLAFNFSYGTVEKNATRDQKAFEEVVKTIKFP